MSKEQPKPEKPFAEALHDFLRMARGRSQGRMIRFFLEQVVRHSDLCEQGSIMLFVPPDTPAELGRLVLFDVDENENRRAASERSLQELLQRRKSFEIDEGLAGLAFRKRAPEFAADVQRHPQFKTIPGQNIGSMHCVPIVLDDRFDPFGVVSFHNARGRPVIDAKQQREMEVAVDVLAAALALSPRPIMTRDRIFIVHGRDEKVREELAAILREAGVEPVVIQSLARTGQDLLASIEKQIRDCIAGFVLLTPDDEGRLYHFGETLKLRARQNVIFESGYVSALFRGTQRVCFLQGGDLEIPSDLNGLLMERYDGHIDPDRIRLTLKAWGIGEDDNPDPGLGGPVQPAAANGRRARSGRAPQPRAAPGS